MFIIIHFQLYVLKYIVIYWIFYIDRNYTDIESYRIFDVEKVFIQPPKKIDREWKHPKVVKQQHTPNDRDERKWVWSLIKVNYADYFSLSPFPSHISRLPTVREGKIKQKIPLDKSSLFPKKIERRRKEIATRNKWKRAGKMKQRWSFVCYLDRTYTRWGVVQFVPPLNFFFSTWSQWGFRNSVFGASDEIDRKL